MKHIIKNWRCCSCRSICGLPFLWRLSQTIILASKKQPLPASRWPVMRAYEQSPGTNLIHSETARLALHLIWTLWIP